MTLDGFLWFCWAVLLSCAVTVILGYRSREQGPQDVWHGDDDLTGGCGA